VTAARPIKLISTPTQHIGFTISFKKTRVITKVKIGAEAIIKLLTPAGTLTEPVLNKYEYRKTPDKPLAINNGKSFNSGKRSFFINPMRMSVIDAAVNRITMRDTGL
jgi:hypothetical protein